MKTILFIVFTLILGGSVMAQDLGFINSEVQKQIGSSLSKYYSLKNTLVASNPEIASKRADEFCALLEVVESGKMTDEQKIVWEKLSTSLKSDAKHIRETTEIEHQRKHFIQLSITMYSLVFNFKANETEAYLQYCPMKKASWLSDSKDIRNPYYGDKMLDCGSVKSTLKKNK